MKQSIIQAVPLDVSNTGPIAIFTTYLATAAVLTAACIKTITSVSAVRSPRRDGLSSISAGTIPYSSRSSHDGAVTGDDRRWRPAMATFVALAVLSLASTWYYMFLFFRWSYLDWAPARELQTAGAPASLSGLRLGDWLRDTTLFKQAWVSTLETPPRAWWTLQIFGFCANWSISLAVQAKKRGIPRAWIFVLLGQFVAISFAMNLSFLALLVRDAHQPSSLEPKGPDAKHKQPELMLRAASAFSIPWNHLVLGFSIALALVIPSCFQHPYFLWLLLTQHFLTFAPLLPCSQSLGEPSWRTKAASQAVILAVATSMVARRTCGLAAVAEALYEHPAVSSVGWDVVCCWLSSSAWYMLGAA
ncbi:hypothetical protein HIM_07343 [Hirsutella minnesotensis 3608]|uniref:Uncharacterized protein n=1 Tax=Hirsutella minnesotensis 3608 TaxID=1043627 RepID=A0A0F8A4C5_9HYPO|nr:hypothetical protein HIM_07343 [Hirsutella minnesotensis 3608]